MKSRYLGLLRPYKNHLTCFFIRLNLSYGTFLPTYIFITVIVLFHVRNIWALVLAGALYGWVLEGVIVWQMYEALPFSISWTPLGWHVIVDVWLGWYLVRRIMLNNHYIITAIFALGLGVFWGVWATWYGIEQALIEPGQFAQFTLFVGFLWIIANAALGKLLMTEFKPSKAEIGVCVAAIVILFAVQIVPMIPIALFVLPPLIAISLYALWRNRYKENRPHLLNTFRGPVHWANYGLLYLTPLTASLTYPIFYQHESPLPIVDILVPILMIGGFVLLVMALWILIVRTRVQGIPSGHRKAAKGF